MTTQNTPRTRQANPDPLKEEASIQVIVCFIDGNRRTFYSGDIRYRGKWQYGHKGYWVQYWKHRIEHETPEGWQGRVVSGAIFHNNVGNRGDKIAQFDKGKGWQ
ncbi:hypothetical protein P1X15_10125 [Runella sp. MFBS21]|uniref:hypothetical protein n=1 Tax=Runella TaxID=105 RepID=UPI002357E60E|nr:MULTISPECIES: hypothetical protein [Runella]MDF7817955.1 hypothetical protein [Runella sp. MFBS21]